MEDGSSLQPVWNTSSSLNEQFILKRQLTFTISSLPDRSNGLAFSSSCISPCLNFEWEWDVFLGNVRKKSLSIPLLSIHGLSVDSTYRRKITGNLWRQSCMLNLPRYLSEKCIHLGRFSVWTVIQQVLKIYLSSC